MLAMAFGLSSLFLSIAAIFVPVFGVFIAGVSGILAWISVGRAVFLGGAAVLINVFNIFLYSPTFLALVALEASQRTPDQSRVLNVWIVVLAIQVIAVLLFIFNAILHSLYRSDSNADKPDQMVPEDGEDPIEINDPFKNPQRDTYEGSTRPSSPARITRIMVKKTQGGRAESNKLWENDSLASPFAEETDRVKKRSNRMGSPLIAVSFVFILVLAGWAGFNFYGNGLKRVPLNRVYEGVSKKSDYTKETAPPALRSNAGGIYEPATDDELSRKTLSGSDENIYSWKDKTGRLQFSNVNSPQNGQEVTHHPELIDDRERTAVEIADNKIFIPITIIHNSTKLETSLQVNSSFSRSVLPARIANFLKADLLSAKSVKTIDGGEMVLEKRKVDYFKVGPHVEHGFVLVAQEGTGGVNRGILGQDFLLKHPYSIDYENQVIIWQ